MPKRIWVKSYLTDLNSTIVCHPTKRKKIPKIRVLTEFNEIFSVDILMNKRYNAPVILFTNFYIFSGQFSLKHISLRICVTHQRYVVQS